MKEYHIGIDGMYCSMCEVHINDAIRNHFKVKKVKANRKRKEALVQSEETLLEADVKKVLNDLGYELTSFEEGEMKKHTFF
ncbi:MAG: heavy-metal-associated domain-containing protein [Solobacterium sp.]|nr:heavy-metal-associated domain-containing protein [Solobacterium sp.]